MEPRSRLIRRLFCSVLGTSPATIRSAYRENIEKDPALERRFQQVFVGEPSVEDTIAILRGLKQRYEAHHKVTIGDDALVAAATLSNRYITGRQLPDKAIDLVDEAAAHLRMELDSQPEEIDELQRKVTRLEMEEMQLKKAEDPASKDRLAKLQSELADSREQLAGLKARWDAEKAGHNKVGDLRAKPMLSSFSFSPCIRRPTGTPVHSETMPATESASTWSGTIGSLWCANSASFSASLSAAASSFWIAGISP